MLCTLTQMLQMLQSAHKGKDRGWGVQAMDQVGSGQVQGEQGYM